MSSFLRRLQFWRKPEVEYAITDCFGEPNRALDDAPEEPKRDSSNEGIQSPGVQTEVGAWGDVGDVGVPFFD